MVALFAERKSGLVGNDDAVGVQLQDRSRALGRNRAIAHVMHGLGLGLAVGDNQDHAGIHDGLGAHGVGLAGHVVDAVEQAAVGLNGALGKVDAVRALGEVIVGLVEANVTVVTDAEQLQIGVTGGSDALVVLGAGSGGVGVEPSGTCVLFRSMLM